MQVKILMFHSVFIIVLSIFRNSPIGGNSPISCGGKRHTYSEHFPQSQICHQSFLFPWAMELGGGGGRLKKTSPFFD